MITCKEDLIDTYIENDRGELRDLYIEKMKEYGIRSCGDSDFKYLHEGEKKYIACMTEFNENGQCEWSCYASDVDDLKQLALSDLKPTKQSTAVETLERMGYEWKGGEWINEKPVEYEYIKVTDSIFDLRDEFERGELYTKWKSSIGDTFEPVTGDEKALSSLHLANELYRRTEKQVDWRDDVYDYLRDCQWFNGSTSIGNAIMSEHASSAFLELCRTVLRARGEL